MDEIIYHFYYSANHLSYLNKLNSERFYKDRVNARYVNGKRYTEMARVGITPLTNHFGDLQIVHTAPIKDVKIT